MVILATKVFHNIQIEESKVNLMLTRFHNMKLWFVKRLKEWNTCCYKYHREVNELRLGANNMKTIGNNVHNHCACLCETVYKPKVNGGSNGDPLVLPTLQHMIC